ncbi:AbiJ-NTD4 domain-containing protein [Sphingomonas qilianensis]|uniref:HEPN AbiJ-N-terminal domain-containing protein n=1 Tax=Sphingomonas qilianensis TaxID=1736690 RepID=A0ABU9XVI9_9SPHN
MNDENAAATPLDRTRVTFRQAEGADPLPAQLALGVISPALEARLWALMYRHLKKAAVYIDYSDTTLGGSWRSILDDWFILHEHWPIDYIASKFDVILSQVKSIVTSRNYLDVFEFIQFVIRHKQCPYGFDSQINSALLGTMAAYRVINDTVMPIVSAVEAKAVLTAFADLEASEYNGARAHLRKAGELLTKGSFAESVRESIHSVEAVARHLEPTASTLGPALHKLQTTVTLNPNMKRGFNALYDYTSDEQGIRHALIDQGAPVVDETDALYMFGACASFVTYLIRKSKA